MSGWRSALVLLAGMLSVVACSSGDVGAGPSVAVVADPGPSVEITIEQVDAIDPPSTVGVLSVAPAADGVTGDAASDAGGADGTETIPDGGASSTTETTASTGAPSPTSPSAPPGPARPATGPATSVAVHAAVSEVVAFREPSADAEVVTALAHPTPVGAPLVFLAVDGGPSVADWVQVQLPVQPNGTTGWVRRADVELYANPYRIEIDRSTHRLWVYERGRLWIETPIAVGTGATPTPVGEFYLLELLAAPDPTGPYGPYAFGLSGFSEVLETFGGADSAVIGLHGTDEPSALGTDVSFGCIRLANEVIEQLAVTLPLGTPVAIT